MYWLRLLIISCNLDLLLHLKGLPGTLKVLHWYGYPFATLPSKEKMDQLVYLKMQNSKIKLLSNENDRQSMKNLQILDLSHSKYLVQTPNFFELQNLKRLILEGCTSLVEIDSSIGQLHFLVEVNLRGCLNLKVLPRKLEINSLEEFVLSGCTQVRNLPEFGKKMEKLRTLDVKETSIANLPNSLGYLTSMKTLQLMGCRNLVCLPEAIQKLKDLAIINIRGCSKFSSLPLLSGFAALQELDAIGTGIKELPSSIVSLKEIRKMSFSRCKTPTGNSSILPLLGNQMFQSHSFPKGLTLPTSVFNIIESLRELDLSYCNIVDGIIPNDLSDLLSLQKLDLSGNKLASLPNGCISNLLNLQSLYLTSCPKLQFLPQPSPRLNIIDAGECGSLRTLSDQKLLQLFSSMEQDGEHAKGLRGITTFSVTIPGSEIPPWFEDQNHLYLNEKHVASVTIDIPKDEWLGIGLCTIIDDKICLPRWGFDFKASDGKCVSLPGRTRKHEKEIKSSHLWIVFWKITEENRDDLLRNYSQIHLKFSTDWEQQPPSKVVDVKSNKCGWRFIRKGDLEQLKDDGKTWCSEAEEQEQWSSLSTNENPQIIIDTSEAISQVASSPCLEEKVKSEDSQRQLITHHACHHDFPTTTANQAITGSPSSSNYSSAETCSSSSCCPFDDNESTISIYYSIYGTQVSASRERNDDVGETLVPNVVSTPNMSDSKQTSAEEILKELSQVPDLSDSELVQIYILLTENEREYESFKALPTPLLRKLWIWTQIKRYYT